MDVDDDIWYPLRTLFQPHMTRNESEVRKAYCKKKIVHLNVPISHLAL